MDFAITETGTPIYPVTVEEMKLFSRVDNDDEDILIQQLIAGVTGEAEDITGRVFAKRSFTLSADAPLDAAMTIPVVPCTVNSVLVDGKTIEQIIREDSEKKYPEPEPLFPPHGVLDFDWSILEDPPANWNMRMLDLGK